MPCEAERPRPRLDTQRAVTAATATCSKDEATFGSSQRWCDAASACRGAVSPRPNDRPLHASGPPRRVRRTRVAGLSEVNTQRGVRRRRSGTNVFQCIRCSQGHSSRIRQICHSLQLLQRSAATPPRGAPARAAALLVLSTDAASHTHTAEPCPLPLVPVRDPNLQAVARTRCGVAASADSMSRPSFHRSTNSQTADPRPRRRRVRATSRSTLSPPPPPRAPRGTWRPQRCARRRSRPVHWRAASRHRRRHRRCRGGSSARSPCTGRAPGGCA